MAKGEINLLCSDIDTLLTDICKFLNEEIQNGIIPESSKAFANILIQRSKVQLEAISKITSTLDISDPVIESYVDMQSPKVIVTLADPQEVYSDVSFEGNSNFSVLDDISSHFDICPYENLPANNIKEGKSGFLYRKEKFLFFDQQRKIFAAIQQSWLLIYMNEQAFKPSQTFDLAGYNAKAITSAKEIKKREETFSLCSLDDSKTYQFTALTSKDMLQWVSAINLQSEIVQAKRCLPPIPAGKIAIENDGVLESDSSNDYEPLTEYRLNKEQTSQQLTFDKKPLPLPPRNTPTKQPHRVIQRQPSEESMGDYDCVGPGPEDSFSDENEEDAVYDNPTELKQNSQYSNNVPMLETGTVDDDEIYDYLQLPSHNVVNTQLINNFSTTTNESKNEIIAEKQNKDKLLKEKHKPMLKPKILSFSHKRKNN